MEREMKIVHFGDVSRRIIEEVAQVAPRENVLILTDTDVSERITASLASAAHAAGGVPSILVMMPCEYPGAPLPPPVEQAVRASEVVLMAASKSLAHAEVIVQEQKKRRLVSMPGIMEETFIDGGGTIDLKELKEITEKVSRILAAGRRFELKSDKGSQAVFECRGKAFPRCAAPPVPTGCALFPDGEAITTLYEKTLEGRIVIDVYQTGVGPLREPIDFEVKKGKVVRITGGIEARLLRELLEQHGDEHSTYFGEFALGTNPRARFIGSAGEDKKVIGTVHFALGDDIGIGGELRSKLHLDGVIGRPTLVVDRKILIEDGKLLIG
jgi:leucyl aminopeptidase (aminopeptidase T)